MKLVMMLVMYFSFRRYPALSGASISLEPNSAKCLGGHVAWVA